MKKYSKIFKAICLAISALFILSSVPFSASAADQPSLGVADLTPEAFHSIVSQSENKLPDEIYANLSLCEEDLPEAMTGSGIEETEAVVRLKGQEKELSSLLYANADGTYTEYFFSENVKYGKDGTVKDKSNKLTYSENLGGFTNEENDINVILPTVYMSENGVSLSYGKNVISFTAEECASSEAEYIKGENGKDKVVYKNVFAPGVDLEYHAQFSGVKENIILNTKPQSNTFLFRIKTNGAYLQNENGTVLILDEKGEGIGYIGELYIYDAEGKTGSGEVQLEEIKAGDEYLYTVTVDNEYLNSADTVYPVTVDPEYIYQNGDTYYDSAFSYIAPSYYYLIPSASQAVLNEQSMFGLRMIATFPDAVTRVKSLESADQLLSAVYTLKAAALPASGSVAVSCYRMNLGWSVTDTSGNVYLWNAYDTSTLLTDSFTLVKGYVDFDLINYFKYWRPNSHVNNGIMIKLTNENTSSFTVACKEYTTESLRPRLVLRYSMAPLPDSPYSFITEKSLYRIINNGNFESMVCNCYNGYYNIATTSSTAGPGSTLLSSQFFSIESVGSTGYYKISPTNRNSRGSSDLYETGQDYYLCCTETGVTLSDADNEYTDWYFVLSYASFYIINRHYDYRCIVSLSPSLYNLESDTAYSKWAISKVGLDVPLIMQSTDNNCSAANVLQCLVYLGLESHVTGNTYSEQMGQIYPEMFSDGKVKAYKLIEYIDDIYSLEHSSYTPYIFRYKSNGADLFVAKIEDCINMGFPVILNIFPKDNLGYYTGYTSTDGHYIIIAGYDNDNDNYIVRDCNRLGSGHPYFGEFVISKIELCKAYGAIAS